MSTVIDAPTEDAAAEAEAALEQSDAARLAAAAASGKTASQRAGDDDQDDDQERVLSAPAARGEIDGISWDEIIGGDLPTEEAMAFAGTGFKVMEVPAGGIKKGKHYVMVLDVVAVGHNVIDSLDTDTGEPTKTRLTKKVRVRSARFLKSDEIVITDPELAARAAELEGS